MSGRFIRILAALLLWSMHQIAVAGTVTYVYTDPQGTPLAEADASGVITATFDYKPYGSQALGTSKAGPGYTGHVNDPDTGFVYMQARYYDPMVGRFLSVDPIQDWIGLNRFNRFCYSNSNPIRYEDPNGKNPVSPLDWFYFAKDVGGLVVTEGVYVAATISGNQEIATMAADDMRDQRLDAATSAAGVISPAPGVKGVHAIFSIVKGAENEAKAASKMRTVVEDMEAVKKADKLTGSKAEGYEKIKDMLSRGEVGKNQHSLRGDLAGKSAADLPGSGRGRGADRVIFSSDKDTVTIHDIDDYH
jgi:RHS repeat-associated protein